MWNAIAEHECVDVFRIDNFPQHSGETVQEAADCAGFVVCEVAESAHVSLRLDDQPASVRGCSPEDVTGVHEVILMEDSPVRCIALTVLLANEATRRRFD